MPGGKSKNNDWDNYVLSLRNKTNLTAYEKRIVENWNKEWDQKEQKDKESMNRYITNFESNNRY